MRRIRFFKKKMRYIGSIYRTSKGQYMHNKFFRNLFDIHLKWLFKTNTSVNNHFWSKLSLQFSILNSRIIFFGNISKFEKDYYNDLSDNSFLFISKKYITEDKYSIIQSSRPMLFAYGACFVNINDDVLVDFDTCVDKDIFFKKTSVLFFFNEVLHKESYFQLDSQFTFHTEIYLILEIYKIILMNYLTKVLIIIFLF